MWHISSSAASQQPLSSFSATEEEMCHMSSPPKMHCNQLSQLPLRISSGTRDRKLSRNCWQAAKAVPPERDAASQQPLSSLSAASQQPLRSLLAESGENDMWHISSSAASQQPLRSLSAASLPPKKKCATCRSLQRCIAIDFHSFRCASPQFFSLKKF